MKELIATTTTRAVFDVGQGGFDPPPPARGSNNNNNNNYYYYYYYYYYLYYYYYYYNNWITFELCLDYVGELQCLSYLAFYVIGHFRFHEAIFKLDKRGNVRFGINIIRLQFLQWLPQTASKSVEW